MSRDLEPYDEQLFEIFAHENQWLTFESKELIIGLIKRADKQFETNTVEGILSSVLIYQQVLEEFLRVLLQLSNLYIQGEIWPNRINLAVKAKMMFGELLKEHKRTIHFDSKENLLKSCEDFSVVRNKFVHKLLKFGSHEEMLNEAIGIKHLFHQAFEHYLSGRAFLEWILLDLQKRLGLENTNPNHQG